MSFQPQLNNTAYIFYHKVIGEICWNTVEWFCFEVHLMLDIFISILQIRKVGFTRIIEWVYRPEVQKTARDICIMLDLGSEAYYFYRQICALCFILHEFDIGMLLRKSFAPIVVLIKKKQSIWYRSVIRCSSR